ncbi:tRNA-binding EMAP/Myf-like protein [Paraburkholderia sp. GAS448]
MKPGRYRWKPATMRGLADLGLVCCLENGTFAPTPAGIDLLRASREGKRRQPRSRPESGHESGQ